MEQIEKGLEELLEKKQQFWETICKRVISEREMQDNCRIQFTIIRTLQSDMLRQL